MNELRIPLIVRSILIGFVMQSVVAGGATVSATEGLKLSLQATGPVAAGHAPNDIKVAITFTNTGAIPVKLLKCYRPLPIFFEVKIVKEDGTIIDVPGAGKISFAEGAIKYVELEQSEFFGCHVSLGEVLKEPLQSGVYTVSVTYKNQYGVDCFRGRLESNEIQIEVEPK